jgi:plasmid maintenance system antidote protein VapI
MREDCMSFLREYSGLGTRPYPLDRERRKRVLTALAEREMSISGLARAINLPQPLVSVIVNGRRLSPKTERRIAEYLGRPVESLFPSRTAEEIGRMRKAEAARKGRTA